MKQATLSLSILLLLCGCEAKLNVESKPAAPPPQPVHATTNSASKEPSVGTVEYLEDVRFREGIYWGAIAMVRGATNLLQAEVWAYQLRADAAKTVAEQERLIREAKSSGKKQ